MAISRLPLRLYAALLCVLVVMGCDGGEDRRVLVFSRTLGFRHDSISPGVTALMKLGQDNGFQVEATEDPTRFSESSLQGVDAVVFLNTTGDVLDDTQQAAFERYVRAGGGFVGIHSAADTEYGWPWYARLVGAQFISHPQIQRATIAVTDRGHASTSHLPERWESVDEWYDFRANPRGRVHVLASLDESTYGGGFMGADHPISWFQAFEGGRSWYTAKGHTRESYSDPQFLQHLLGGIRFAARLAGTDPPSLYSNELNTVVLAERVDQGMELAVAPDGRVLFIERAGKVKIHRPGTSSAIEAGTLAVTTCDEDGLLGLTLDPGFAQNGWLYLFYSPAGAVPEQRVSRFSLAGDRLDLASERVVLRIPTQRQSCNHSAGSLAFGPDGNLFVSTGDNTNPFDSNGYSPLDERPGRGAWDAQKSAANTHDLRGKILRIAPRPDGSYGIPEGNLFPSNGTRGRPEIYVMGCRNPFRFSLDPVRGWLVFGDVGPDARGASADRGPAGHDELNVAQGPANFGWPYFVGDNLAYRDHDFASGQSGPAFDPDAPVNDSPNSGGARVLPPAQRPALAYPYAFSAAWPQLGSGMRTLLAGPVYRRDPAARTWRGLPARHEGALLVYEFMRNLILDVRLDAAGRVSRVDRLPTLPIHLPIDIEVGGDGALYVLEFGGDGFFNPGPGRLVRIESRP